MLIRARLFSRSFHQRPGHDQAAWKAMVGGEAREGHLAEVPMKTTPGRFFLLCRLSTCSAPGAVDPPLPERQAVQPYRRAGDAALIGNDGADGAGHEIGVQVPPAGDVACQPA